LQIKDPQPDAAGHIKPTVAAATSRLPQGCLQKAAHIEASSVIGMRIEALGRLLTRGAYKKSRIRKWKTSKLNEVFNRLVILANGTSAQGLC
jgi:hypothetical protein